MVVYRVVRQTQAPMPGDGSLATHAWRCVVLDPTISNKSIKRSTDNGPCRGSHQSDRFLGGEAELREGTRNDSCSLDPTISELSQNGGINIEGFGIVHQRFPLSDWL